MRKIAYFATLLSLIGACGCAHTVHLTVKNSLPATAPAPSLIVAVGIKDRHGKYVTTQEIGIANPSSSVKPLFDWPEHLLKLDVNPL